MGPHIHAVSGLVRGAGGACLLKQPRQGERHRHRERNDHVREANHEQHDACPEQAHRCASLGALGTALQAIEPIRLGGRAGRSRRRRERAWLVSGIASRHESKRSTA